MRVHWIAFVCLSVVALGACARAVVRPAPAMGHREDARTVPGTYDGYSTEWCQLDAENYSTEVLADGVIIRSQGSRELPTPRPPKRSPLSGTLEESLGVRELLRRGLVSGSIHERPGFCRFSHQSIVLFTDSYHNLDAIVQYVGHSLKKGDYQGEVVIQVDKRKGRPGDVRTAMGDYDGYSVGWCGKPGKHQVIVITGNGSRDVFDYTLHPEHAHPPEDFFRTVSTFPSEGEGCHREKAMIFRVASYGDVDTLIADIGRMMKEQDYAGEAVVYVTGPRIEEKI
jgi:hypothetical protein